MLLSLVPSRKLVLICLSLAVLLAVCVPLVTADYPSHVYADTTSDNGFTFPQQLPLFATLADDARGIVENVRRSDYNNATAHFSSYRFTVDTFTQLKINTGDQLAVICATVGSRDKYDHFITLSRKYDDLYGQQRTLVTAGNTSSDAIRNTLEMKNLSKGIAATATDLDGLNKQIYNVAIQNGLDPSAYESISPAFDNITDRVDRELRNVTDAVFSNTTTTLSANQTAVKYGDTLRFSGQTTSNRGVVSNGSVTIVVDQAPVATTRTNASGYYEYSYRVDAISPGTHAVFAHFEDDVLPYNPSNSSRNNIGVKEIAVTNSMKVSSGSLGPGKRLTFSGTVAADGGPVTNVSVALYVDGTAATQTKTDEGGNYSFVYTMSPIDYVASMLTSRQYAFQSAFQSGNQPLQSAKSDPITASVAESGVMTLPIFVLISTLLLAGMLGAGFVIIRRRRATQRRSETEILDKAPPISEDELFPLPEGVGDAPIRAETTPGAPAPVTEEQVSITDVNALTERARELFASERGTDAIILFYEQSIVLLAQKSGATLAPSMTHAQKCAAVVDTTPEARGAMHALTHLYELARYSDRAVTTSGFNRARAEFASLYDVVAAGERA